MENPTPKEMLERALRKKIHENLASPTGTPEDMVPHGDELVTIDLSDPHHPIVSRPSVHRHESSHSGETVT